MSASGRAIFEGAVPQSVGLPQSLETRPTLLEQVCDAPLHDFPIRDEILRQFLSFGPEMRVMEVGPGAGFTAYWLSRAVRQLTLVDATPASTLRLRRQFSNTPRIDIVQWDLATPGLSAASTGQFDAVFGLDVFEYVPDVASGFRNLAEVLKPEGVLFLTFPNTPPPEGDGVTYFQDPAALEALLKESGFRGVEIFTVRLRSYAGWTYRILHEWPLALLRKLRNPTRTRPQTFEGTWMFRSSSRLALLRRPANLWWSLLGWLMRLDGDLFTENPHGLGILNRQLVIRAWK